MTEKPGSGFLSGSPVMLMEPARDVFKMRNLERELKEDDMKPVHIEPTERTTEPDEGQYESTRQSVDYIERHGNSKTGAVGKTTHPYMAE